MGKVINFLKYEPVLCAAGLLALASSFFVKPSLEYFEYIDFRVLALLLCLMLVVTGFQELGVFSIIIERMLKHIKNTRQLSYVLVLLCFFSSMLITNDVALITFVPFAIMTLTQINKNEMIIHVVVMQTVAANLGSMFTPLGNPQNLYLYSISDMTIAEFLKTMAPITILSFLLIIISFHIIGNEPVSILRKEHVNEVQPIQKHSIGNFAIFVVLFMFCLATVLHIMDYRITMIIVLATVLGCNRKLIWKADYLLLITFIAFFIFVGNVKNIPVISNLLADIMMKRELWISIFISQIISNVPAAVLLSGFTENYHALLLGTNVGGLGTLIASMASLISFKLYSKMENASKSKYLVRFTEVNIIYLMILVIAVKCIY